MDAGKHLVYLILNLTREAHGDLREKKGQAVLLTQPFRRKFLLGKRLRLRLSFFRDRRERRLAATKNQPAQDCRKK